MARFSSVDNFEQSRGAHAAANTHCNNSILGVAPAALDQGMAGHSRAGHAVRMTDCDRSAIDIQLFRVDPELVAAIDHLHRKRLIQLPQIDIIDLKSVTLEKPGHGVNRPHPHFVRLAARCDKAAEDTEWL